MIRTQLQLIQKNARDRRSRASLGEKKPYEELSHVLQSLLCLHGRSAGTEPSSSRAFGMTSVNIPAMNVETQHSHCQELRSKA